MSATHFLSTWLHIELSIKCSTVVAGKTCTSSNNDKYEEPLFSSTIGFVSLIRLYEELVTRRQFSSRLEYVDSKSSVSVFFSRFIGSCQNPNKPVITRVMPAFSWFIILLPLIVIPHHGILQNIVYRNLAKISVWRFTTRHFTEAGF